MFSVGISIYAYSQLPLILKIPDCLTLLTPPLNARDTMPSTNRQHKTPPCKPLQRGTACFPCRRRKLVSITPLFVDAILPSSQKCGAQKPACTQCVAHGRDHECSYENTSTWGKIWNFKFSYLPNHLGVGKKRQMQFDINKLERELGDARQSIQEMQLALQSIVQPMVSPNIKVVSTVHSEQAATPQLIADPAEEIKENMDSASTSPLSEASAEISAEIHTDPLGLLLFNTFPPDPAVDSQLLAQTPPTFLQLKINPKSQAVLLKGFFSHAGQFNFELDPADIVRRIEGPLEQCPYDALLYAMYLIAYRFSKATRVIRYETRFRQRVQYSIRRPVYRTEDLLDCIRASCLLSVYSFINDSLGEARHHIQRAWDYAVRVMSIPSSSPEGHKSLDIVPLIDDEKTLSSSLRCLSLDQQLTLQQAFTADRLIAAYLGADAFFPSCLGYIPPDSLDSSTRFVSSQKPYSSCNRTSSSAPNTPSGSLSPPMRCPSKRIPLDRRSISSLRARAAHLLWSASHASTDIFSLFPNRDPSIHGAGHIHDLHSEIREFKDNLPSIHLPASHPQSDEAYPSSFDRSLLSVHIQMCAAMMQTMRCHAKKKESAGESCISLVGDIVALIREIFENDYQYLDPIIGLCWQWVIEQLLEELHVPKYDELRATVKFILIAMHKLATEIPVVSVNIANVAVRCGQWGIFLS
ncbi:hypothetical protein K439DRAFT_64050 [Ramaria rubella]|nr:hypothetical protein K439DRAFT_64050 [Ramaria rubella]